VSQHEINTLEQRGPLEEIKKAVAEYIAEPDEPGHELEQELENLWYDLSTARRNALNGVWSMACEGAVRRIVRLTRLTGKPTDWGNIQMELIMNRWYETLNEAAGYPTPLTDEEHAYVARLYEEHIGRYQK
jgi:hypothetical protein